MVNPLRTGDYLHRILGQRILANLLAAPLDAAFRLRSVYYSNYGGNQFKHEILNHFDERFSAFWGSIDKAFCFIGHRENRYLNWRLGECPSCHNQIFTLLHGSNEAVLGYVSYSISKERVMVTDLAFDGEWKHFQILMSRFCAHQTRLGMESVTLSFVCSDTLIRQLKKTGFIARGGLKQVMYCPSSEQIDVPGCLVAGDWYLSPADNDV